MDIITVNSTYTFRVNALNSLSVYRNGERLGFSTAPRFLPVTGWDGSAFVAVFDVTGRGPVRTSVVRAVNVAPITL